MIELTTEPTADELAAFDDLTGVELSEYATDEPLVTVPWLSSLLYSDYQDPGDDDDREGMPIPRHVLDNL